MTFEAKAVMPVLGVTDIDASIFEYGIREFGILDPDGDLLAFAEELPS